MLDVLFAGSPDCAVPSLEALAGKHRIVAVLTNPPARAGRSGIPVPTPVAQAAERLKQAGSIPQQTPVITPEKITQETRDAIAATNPALMVCFAYGKIFGPKTLALFPMGAINIHPSLLPRWRGSTPVPAAILARDPETGITIQKMALEMDSGDILAQKTILLDGMETAESLLSFAAGEAVPLVLDTLARFEKGPVKGLAQDNGKATFCAMLSKEHGLIDWSQSALDIDAKIRAFHPWPGTFTPVGSDILLVLKAKPWTGDREAGTAPESTAKGTPFPGTVIGVDKKAGILVQTGNGILALEQLQWKTKKPLDWKSFLNGSRNFLDTQLGKSETA